MDTHNSFLPCMAGVKVIFTDLDNTLWIPQSRNVPRRNVVTLRQVQSQGILVIPVTGRSLNACHRALNRNGLHDLRLYPGVYCDGAVIYDETKEVMHSNFLSHNVVAKVRSLVETMTLNKDGMVGYFCHNAFKATDLKRAVELYAYPSHNRKDPQSYKMESSSHDLREISTERKRSLEDLTTESTRSSEETATDVPAFHIGTPRTPWDDNIELLPENLKDEKVVYFYIDGREHQSVANKIKSLIGVEGFDYCHQNPRYTVIRNEGCDKYAAIKILMAKYGWNEDECLIVGDGDNDVCMLRGFKNSLVMKDGYESALAAGKYRTVYGAADGGWGHAISQMLLQDVKRQSLPYLS